MTVPALIALGGNTGDVRATFAAALHALDQTDGVRMIAGSRTYRTPAVGANAGGEFLNAAATLETTLAPHALLGVLQRLEADAGRERTTRWGPRPLDLDLILFGEERIVDARLTIPHPGLGWRRFVLDPACEVAGDWDRRRTSIRQFRERLHDRPLRVGLTTDDPAFLRQLADALEPEFPVSIERREPGVRSMRLPPALHLVWEDAGKPPRPNRVPIPRNAVAAIAVLRDVLAAALPDPEPQPIGEPLWSA